MAHSMGDGSQDKEPSKQSMSDSLERQLNVRDLKGSRSQDNDGATTSSWEGWAIRSPDLEAEISKGGGGLDVGHDFSEGDVRPSTAAAAMESKPALFPVPTSSGARPPAGMMTVRVKIGKEETSLVTPNVVTENGGTEGSVSETAETGGPRGNDHKTDKTFTTDHGVLLGKSARARANITDATTVGGRQIPVVAMTTAQQSSLSSGEEPTVRRVMEMIGTATAPQVSDVLPMDSPLIGTTSQVMDTLKPLDFRGMLGPAKITSDESMAYGNHPDAQSPLPVPPVATMVGRNSLQATSKIAEAICPAEDSEVDVHPRQVVTAVDNFMEDSQVYLGCSVCGVKYLVEAVDVRLPESAEGVWYYVRENIALDARPLPFCLVHGAKCGQLLRGTVTSRSEIGPKTKLAAAGRRPLAFRYMAVELVAY